MLCHAPRIVSESWSIIFFSFFVYLCGVRSVLAYFADEAKRRWRIDYNPIGFRRLWSGFKVLPSCCCPNFIDL